MNLVTILHQHTNLSELDIYKLMSKESVRGLFRRDFSDIEAHQIAERLDFLVQNLGMHESMILSYPRILNPRFCSSEENFALYAQHKIDILESAFGITVDSVRRFPYILQMDCDPQSTAPSSVAQKMRYFRTKLGLSVRNINQVPQLFTYSITHNDAPNSLVYKARFLNEKYGFTKQTFAKNPAILLFDCQSTRQTSLYGKMEFLQKTAGLSIPQIKQAPALLGLDCDPKSTSPTALVQKMKNLQAMGILPKAWTSYPVILAMDCDPQSTNPTSIAQKLEFYRENLGFCAHQVNTFPQLIGLTCSHSRENPANILNKRDFYQKYLGITVEDLAKFPNLLGYDCDPKSTSPTAVIKKVELLQQNNIEMEIFRKYPMIIAMPCEAIKIRYMLYRLSDAPNWCNNSSIFIQNEKKTYARLRHICDTNNTAKMYSLIYPEDKFARINGVRSADLMKQYPLNTAAVGAIEDDYAMLTNQEMQLTDSELAACAVRE